MAAAKDSVLDAKLIKWTGLYDILNPDTATVLGVNAYHAAGGLAILYVSAATSIIVVSIFLLHHSLILSMFYVGCVINISFTTWKFFVVLYRSRDIWACYTGAAGLGAMSYRDYDRSIHDGWRARSIGVTNAYVLTTVSCLVLWGMSPFALENNAVTIERLDGSRGVYRLNIYLLVVLVSDQTYNDNFGLFYAVEFTISNVYAYFAIAFDLLLLMMTFELYGQLETICDAIASLGHGDATTAAADEQPSVGKKILSKANRDKSDDLKAILSDHQLVMKKMEEFLNIFRVTFLIQIIISSSSIIIILYAGIISFVFESNADDRVFATLMISLLPIYLFQLFMTCYLFATLNEKKESIVFALYCSNWTEMDLKSKKLVLLAMYMNNANQLQLKFSNIRKVNLEMFASTINFCYSATSMLLNFHLNKSE